MEKKFSWKIWGKKLAIISIEVIIASGLSIWLGNHYWLAVVPLLESFRNWLKHK